MQDWFKWILTFTVLASMVSCQQNNQYAGIEKATLDLVDLPTQQVPQSASSIVENFEMVFNGALAVLQDVNHFLKANIILPDEVLGYCTPISEEDENLAQLDFETIDTQISKITIRRFTRNCLSHPNSNLSVFGLSEPISFPVYRARAGRQGIYDSKLGTFIGFIQSDSGPFLDRQNIRVEIGTTLPNSTNSTRTLDYKMVVALERTKESTEYREWYQSTEGQAIEREALYGILGVTITKSETETASH